MTESSIEAETVTWQLYSDLPPVHAFHSGEYHLAREWYRQVEFSVEQQRGLFHREDWWSPEEFTFSLTPGSTATLTFTSEAEHHSATTNLDPTCRPEDKPFDQGAQEAAHESAINPAGYTGSTPPIASIIFHRRQRFASAHDDSQIFRQAYGDTCPTLPS